MRQEIQALRAVAVLLVVVYHLWPRTAPGGFVGVDVFFVISGFLITAMLVRELEERGTVSLPRFWARRARRLLPASLVCVTACAVATIAFVPITAWRQFFAEMQASTAYVQNWHLAAQAVDYFASNNGPSPVRHFWSLSAEEQFYLAWPLLVLAGALVVRRRRQAWSRGAVAVVLGLATVLSLAYSIYDTAADPAVAYLATPTRAWEFGAGGLLALLPEARDIRWLRVGLAWAGLAAILVAGLAYSNHTAFPGWAAILPVMGTLAVIRAGTPPSVLSPTPVLGLPPVQFIGDLSYSVYLWHWPLLVLTPFALGHRIGDETTMAIFAVTMLAAWVTKVLVEDPVRNTPRLSARRPRWTFGAGAAAMAAVLGLTASATAYVNDQIEHDRQVTQRTLATPPRCFGAASHDPGHPCHNPKLRTLVVPTPVEAPTLPQTPCTMIVRRSRLRVCAFGIAPARAAATVAIIGDSHASALRPALAQVAVARRWRMLSITRSGCPFSRAVPSVPEPARSHCVQWNREVRRWLSAQRAIHTVLVIAHAGDKVRTRAGQSNFAAKQAGYLRAWRALPPVVRRIVVIRDTPNMADGTLDCVQRLLDHHRSATARCAVSRRSALQRDAAATVARQHRSRRVQLIDLSALICDHHACPPVIGGALVYRDEDHLTPVFAATLAPYLQRALHRAITH